MLNALLGKKLKQTRIYTADGTQIPVTEIAAGPCTVVDIRSREKNGYWALQLGFDNQIQKRVSKALSGHIKKTGQGNYLPRFLREIKFQPEEGKEVSYKVGEQVTVDKVFAVGDRVKVTGTTKAKGFQGGVRRHGFAGGPRTHGQSDRERAPGSIGQTTTPGRVYRGKRMAGRMGGSKKTVSGLQVVAIAPETHLLKVKGVVPGSINSLVTVIKE